MTPIAQGGDGHSFYGQDTRDMITYSQFGDSAGRGTSLALIDRLLPA
jgi:hypothetical protein